MSYRPLAHRRDVFRLCEPNSDDWSQRIAAGKHLTARHATAAIAQTNGVVLSHNGDELAAGVLPARSAGIF